jgi:hypothetical protein
MAKWEIRSEESREQEALDRWGKEEWNRRKEVVKKKTEELCEESWEASCVYGTQFEVIARALDQDKFDKMAELPYTRWVMLVDRMVART